MITNQLLHATIGVKIVETLLSFRGYFKLGSKMAPSPSPPGTMLCYFLLPKTLNKSGTTLIRGEGEGVPAKVLFGLFFFENRQQKFRYQCPLLAKCPN